MVAVAVVLWGLVLGVGGRAQAQDIFELYSTSDGRSLVGIPGDLSNGLYLTSVGHVSGEEIFSPGQTGFEYSEGVYAGFYQAPNGRYYAIVPSTPPSTGDEGEGRSARCPCGSYTSSRGKEDVDSGCLTPCPPPRCTSAFPQQTQTSLTSGYFYLFASGVYSGSDKLGWHWPTVVFEVCSYGAPGGCASNYYRYPGIRYGDGSKFYAKINLASHPGVGLIGVNVTAEEWPYGLITTCPAANFRRYSYITGHVYYDPTGTCSTASPWTQTDDLAVGYNEGGITSAGSVQSSGDYAGMYVIASSTAASVSLQLLNKPDEYICSDCNAATCPNKASVAAGSNNNNFFLNDLPDPWWQVTGAGVYGGGAVNSELPDSSMRLLLPAVGGTEGALFTAQGSADLGRGYVSDPGWMATTTYRGKRMDYNYFAANMGVLPAQEDDWVTNNLSNKPSGGKDFYYQAGDSTVDSPWLVSAGESYVIFVNGDLRIAENIEVEQGGFLAFFVKGDVTVASDVTKVQGLYDMSGNYRTESKYVLLILDDDPLEFQGSLVVWGNINMARDLGRTNKTLAGDSFVYRPDLITNMPNRLKSFAMQWQEVAPGTFGN